MNIEEDYDNIDFEYEKEWTIEELKKEIERLNNIIDKAIEYIKINGNWWTDEIEGCQDLIKILKGEEDGI